jgi:hypothetical protein
MLNKNFLNTNGVGRIHFYNVRTPIISNAMTVCLLFNSEAGRIEARGVSICSLLDSFNILKGKHKSFGRAIKSLKRKANFYKINGKGRQDEFVKREMKIRNERDDAIFRQTVVSELRAIDPNTPIQMQMLEGTKYIKKYLYDIPLSYPVEIANKNFKYKAQYRPEPVGPTEIEFVKTYSKKPNFELIELQDIVA